MQDASDKQDVTAGIVVGMSDGLIVPFVLCTALRAAAVDPLVIAGAGLAATVLGALAMGIGAYTAARAGHPDQQRAADALEEKILSQIGLSEETKQLIIEEHARDQEKWKDMIPDTTLQPALPGKSARITALSYVAGGLIPILPYVLTRSSDPGLIWSVAVTAVALLVFGFVRALHAGRSPWLGAFGSLITGLLAAGGAWGVMRLFTD